MGGIAIYALHLDMILISAACTGNIMLSIKPLKWWLVAIMFVII